MKKSIFKEPGEPLSNEDFITIEEIIGKKIPEELKILYCEYNGGILKKVNFIKENGVTISIQKFLTIKDIAHAYLLGQSRDFLPDYLIPFAIDWGGNYYCININDEKIYFFAIDAWDEDLTNDQNKIEAQECLAYSLNEFMDKLTNKRGPY